MEYKYEEQAKELCEAIKKIANNEDTLTNFECYLSIHFNEWFEKFCKTPNGLLSELTHFSNIE